MTLIVENEFILKLCTDALKNILSNTEEVNYGNGVSMENKMYDDVKAGLILSLTVIESLKNDK